MSGLVVAWYAWLSGLAQGPILAIDAWIGALALPAASALLFGLIGATSPCQLTTNLGALAFSASRPGRAGALRASVLYVLGKVTVYSLVGALVILLGLQLQAVSVPVIMVARKVLGPSMVIIGLAMLGLIRLRGGFGQALGGKVRARLVQATPANAFVLGVAFSFAFCPTLFWLFFGLTLPLALRSGGGWAFPGLFAVGTSLPLLALSCGVSFGVAAHQRVVGGMTRLQRRLGRLAGVVFVVAGLHDTLVYWWL